MSDDSLKDQLAALHYNMNYGGQTCIHCGKPVPMSGKGTPQTEAIRSGTDMTKVVPVHASCFYKYEANETWRKNNPDAMPIDEGGERL